MSSISTFCELSELEKILSILPGTERISRLDLSSQYALIDRFISQLNDVIYVYNIAVSDNEAGNEILSLDKEQSRLIILATLYRMFTATLEIISMGREKGQESYYGGESYKKNYRSLELSRLIFRTLLRRKLPLLAEDVEAMLEWLRLSQMSAYTFDDSAASQILRLSDNLPTSVLDRLKPLLLSIYKGFTQIKDLSVAKRRLMEHVQKLAGDSPRWPLQPGEVWSDHALQALDLMEVETQHNWVKLLDHCKKSQGANPTKVWIREAQNLLGQIGLENFKKHLSGWLAFIDKPRSQPISSWSTWAPNPNLLIIEPHMDILKGLAWCCSLQEDDELARILTRLAISTYKKVPNLGPRAVRIGNGCVYALSVMPGMSGIHQLALLKIKVTSRSAQKGIDKALVKTAQRIHMTMDELEEIGVPSYGLSDVGQLHQGIGDFTARLTLHGSHTTELVWVKQDGKVQKSVPKPITDNYAEELKELKSSIKDIQKMLPVQKERLDNLFLKKSTWPYTKWQEYYLNHPLVGYLARRLIWRFDTNGQIVEGIWHEDGLVDIEHRKIEPTDETQISLWHPIHAYIDSIKAWRSALEKWQIQQPFKQAHREIYLLTDAECATGVYSNRFAAHIIKQHQFNALTTSRGWRYTLQGAWDAPEQTASLELPSWNLRAEFWVDGVGEYGQDTTEAGVYYYVSTDQVRFYKRLPEQQENATWSRSDRIDQPLALSELPAIVLSEVLRDVDMFVGVASVGNDPGWSDGGPEGRYRDYWQSYSFGELSATAKTRKEILERLIPRLKIAQRCHVTDKFLVVNGDVRTYKIHLGSGNILMEPNDQYLCIVATRSAKQQEDKLFLPFEGDSMMALILSKAFLLAEDKKITDKTILSQINR